VALFDPQAVGEVAAAGAGKEIALRAGGKSDELHGSPLNILATVQGIHDGRFTEPQARHGGLTRYDMGPTAIVQTAHGMTIQLTSRRTPPVSLGQLTSCGIDPSVFRIIVAKGVHAPVAAYAPVCPRMIRVNTPGVTSADMQSFTFKHRRRPLFPFEEEGIATSRDLSPGTR